jgi:type 1 fimbria pilin
LTKETKKKIIRSKMKKILVLVAVLALVAAMVVPMAAFAANNSTITASATWVGPTINFTAPGSSINLGQLYVNTTTPWGYTGYAGTVSFLPGSDTNGTLALSVTSTPYGQMQNQNDNSYLPNNLSVALGTELSSIASNVDTDGTTAWVYGDLPAGPAAFAVPTTGVSYSFDVAARQVMGAAIPSAGPYQITMNVVAGYTP